MKALPLELRERIVTAVTEGESTKSVAKRFKVSWTSVKRYVKQHREQGHLNYQTPPGKPRKLNEQHLKLLDQKVNSDHDLTIPEYRQWFIDTTALEVSESTIQRAVLKLKLTRKKDLSVTGA